MTMLQDVTSNVVLGPAQGDEIPQPTRILKFIMGISIMVVCHQVNSTGFGRRRTFRRRSMASSISSPRCSVMSQQIKAPRFASIVSTFSSLFQYFFILCCIDMMTLCNYGCFHQCCVCGFFSSRFITCSHSTSPETSKNFWLQSTSVPASILQSS